MRGVWRMAGLGDVLCNRPMFTLDGRHVGTPDLLQPTIRLIGQYNGAGHITLAGTATDVKKDAAFRDLGLEPVTMLATDWTDLGDFVQRLQAAARRAASAPSMRAWTLEPLPRGGRMDWRRPEPAPYDRGRRLSRHQR